MSHCSTSIWQAKNYRRKTKDNYRKWDTIISQSWKVQVQWSHLQSMPTPKAHGHCRRENRMVGKVRRSVKTCLLLMSVATPIWSQQYNMRKDTNNRYAKVDRGIPTRLQSTRINYIVRTVDREIIFHREQNTY